MYLFELAFLCFSGIYPGVELLGHMVVLFLGFFFFFFNILKNTYLLLLLFFGFFFFLTSLLEYNCFTMMC